MELSRYTVNAINALSGAQECAKEFGHRFVGSEHLLMGIIKCGDKVSDLLVRYGVDRDGAAPFIDSVVGGGRSVFTDSFGNTQSVKRILELALYEAKSAGADMIDTDHILLSIMRERDSTGARIIDSLCTDKAALKAALLQHGGEDEDESLPYGADDIESDSPPAVFRKEGSAPVLDAYSVDLTALARQGKLDPVIGRDGEIIRVLQTLCRRTKNNAVLIGDPGVGKSAVAEGIANRIASGSVPAMLADSRLIRLDLSSMIAGTKYRGEFEERLKAALDELKSDPRIILFIDEIHTIVGAGSGEGSLDAANIMKPALARGELRVIGATTVEEYRSFIEKDAALERRFTPVLISEPDKEQTREILLGLKSRYEKHHDLYIDSEAVDAAIDLSVRYIADRRLPDKAIDLIDEACAKKRMLPDQTESVESAAAKGDYELARKLRGMRGASSGCEIHLSAADIAEVIGDRTGLSVDMILGKDRFLGLEAELRKSVFGQDEAIKSVSAVMRRAAAGLEGTDKPFASFVFAGPKGVGKRTLAVRLAETYSTSSVVRLNGNDYSDEASAVRLIGAPAGYKDSEKGGFLTESVKLHPVSVIMITSPDAMHLAALSVLSQILEKGCIEDGRGRPVGFYNSVVIFVLDTNDKSGRLGFSSDQSYSDADKLLKMLPSSVVSNVDDTVNFVRLTADPVKEIVRSQLNSVSEKAAARGITLGFTDETVDSVAGLFSGSVSGLPRRITLLVEDGLSTAVLNGAVASGDTAIVEYKDGEYLVRKVELK